MLEGIKFGDVKQGSEIGLDSKYKYKWAKCPTCTKGKWVNTRRSGLEADKLTSKTKCNACSVGNYEPEQPEIVQPSCAVASLQPSCADVEAIEDTLERLKEHIEVLDSPIECINVLNKVAMWCNNRKKSLSDTESVQPSCCNKEVYTNKPTQTTYPVQPSCCNNQEEEQEEDVDPIERMLNKYPDCEVARDDIDKTSDEYLYSRFGFQF